MNLSHDLLTLLPEIIIAVSAMALLLAGAIAGNERTNLLSGLAVLAMVIGAGCKTTEPPAPPPPEVLVSEVVQKDVPIYTEWVGTTVGFVNAQVMPQVQGYLLKQDYRDGTYVKAGQLLFEIDDRPYKDALDQALGTLAQQRATLRQNQLDVAKYTPLAAEGAVSKQQFDNAVQTMRAGEAQVQAAEAAAAPELTT